MDLRTLRDGAEGFEVTVLEVARPARVVLFAVGGGGDPERHAPLLRALAERGCAVVAPRFERMVSPVPTSEQLALRARRLRLALDAFAHDEVPVVGVGHSIGAAVLLALAGAAMWMDASAPLPIARDPRLARLVLLAPPTAFFQPPNALDGVGAPLLVWAGGRDTVTPPAQAALLKRSLGGWVDLRVTRDAGHFSFMDVPPPNTLEPHPDRATFLAELTRELLRFALGEPSSPAGR